MIDKNNLSTGFLRAMHREATLKQPSYPLPSEKLAREAFPAPERAVETALTTKTTDSPSKPKKGRPAMRGRRQMNKTEQAYAAILEAQKRSGEIMRYEWEGLTIRWPDGMTYTPDFVVWHNDIGNGNKVAWPDDNWRYVRFIETKGAWIEEDAKVKFRAARAHWPEFEFQMWQLKKKEWTRLL